MGAKKPREERRSAYVRARLRTDEGWSDVTIGNVSSRGMMLRCTAPLPLRTFIEVRHQGEYIVGRIVWSHGLQCGVRTQDVVDIAGLLAQKQALAGQPSGDRRAAARGPKPVRTPSVAETADRSRRIARLFDFAVIAAGTISAAVLVAQLSGSVLGDPLADVKNALAGSPASSSGALQSR